ncbi:MAG: efflux RND transporter periplasmic adaptor subunit, partial [Candidatus Acidiferrum sp.]
FGEGKTMKRAIRVRRRLWPALAFLFCIPLIVSGCSPPAATHGEVIRPVKTMLVVAGSAPRVRVFPGRVDASKRVELAFQVPGLLVEFPVKEGQKVAKGEVIGQLRPDEFQARLKSLQGQLDQARAALRAVQSGERPEQQARLESQVRAADANLANTRAEFNRNARLLRSNAVSREEHELSQTNMRIAQEEFNAARQLLEKGTIGREEDIDAHEAAVRGLEGRVVEANLQLADTTLHAPYDGVIAKRFVELRQNIKAKVPVVRFQDVDEIEVAVDVPETVMAADLRSADIVELLAEFSGAPGLQFPVHRTEIAQAADPTTQTFRLRAAMQAPKDINLLPGMTATVTMRFRRADILDKQIHVPISAVSKDSAGAQVAWVITSGAIAERRPVKVGQASGGTIAIIDGLQPGERIAVAGVNFLREGMKVRDLGGALGGG